ncbi:MAG: DNA/RNA non-specific endonuclease [Bacteroidales bacterium]|nr:DNA/RNA non-specific endonuclease [Bacteroidales bacterium]MBR6864876.1 DNA/RNA non-specific endonuclease [Bacteroidales bacterium]
MRTLRYLLLPTAFFAVVACQKTKMEDPKALKPQEEESVIVFVSERPQTDDQTRTHWDGTTILWDQADFIRMGYTVNGKWQNATGDASATDAKLYGSQNTTLSEEGAVASFSTNVNFTGTTQGEHVFYAVFPGNATESTMTAAPVATVTLPSVQVPLADSFDRLADLMLGHSIDEYSERPETPVRLVWDRVVAHGHITLKSLPGVASGEKVSAITLTGQADANLVGEQSMNIITGEYSATSKNTEANKLVIQGDNLTIDTNGNVTFWMSILPVSLTSLTVEVATNKAVYTRTITGFTREFIANRRNILSINMANATKTTTQGPAYHLVTSNEDFGEGHYLIAYTVDGTSATVLSGKASGSNYGTYASGITVTNGAIEYTAGNPYDIEVKATATGYSFQLGSTYLGYTGSSNSLYFDANYSANRDDWTVSIDSNGNAVIASVASTERFIQWNSNSGQERFACYKGTMKSVQLYKLESTGPSLATKSATGISVASATLNAMFANLGTNVTEARFLWGTSADNLSNTLYAQDFDVTSGEFHATLASLDENTTYYFQAVVQYHVDGQADYVELSGDVLSFKTLSSSSGGNAGLQWLGCYEVPAIDLVNTTAYSGRGEETNVLEETAYWYNYFTTSSKQRAVTHSYVYEGKTYRNYTVLYDGNRHCPLWVAQVMHAGAYPNNKVGRNESWVYDPGIPDSWQQKGLQDASLVGFSRGHFCASSDRQTCVDANRETFYFTNQAPQWQEKFNGSGGAWYNLEQDIPEPTGRDTLYVVQGVLFEGTIQTLPSTDNKDVSIPSHFYKLLMKCSFNTSGAMTAANGVAYLFTNEEHAGGYSSFATTIREIENRTGIDFFTNIPTEFQEPAEKMSNQLW